MCDCVSECVNACGMFVAMMRVSLVAVCHRDLELFGPEVPTSHTLPARSAGCHPAHLRQWVAGRGRYKVGNGIFECGLRQRAVDDGSFANGKKGVFSHTLPGGIRQWMWGCDVRRVTNRGLLISGEAFVNIRSHSRDIDIGAGGGVAHFAMRGFWPHPVRPGGWRWGLRCPVCCGGWYQQHSFAVC